jgi:anti-anti-sigma regulatory factor
MATIITQIDDLERNRMILRVGGTMTVDDAVVLERIANDLHESSTKNITIDLADLDFLDSESAPILKRLENTEGFEIEGTELFLQTAINEVERVEY